MGLRVSPLCQLTATPWCVAASFAGTAGALCTRHARDTSFWLEAPVNPVPHPRRVPAPELLRALLLEVNEQFCKTP